MQGNAAAGPPLDWLALSFLVFAAFLWSGSFVAIKLALENLPLTLFPCSR